MFALVAGFPEAGAASQSGPYANPDSQGAADRYLRSGLAPADAPVGLPAGDFILAADVQVAEYWSARSSDTSVVTVTVRRGSRANPEHPDLHVWIRPVGTGEATVTVSYTADGNSVSASFTVTVADDPPDTFDPYATANPQHVANRSFGVLQVGGSPGKSAARFFIAANDQMADYSAHWSARSSDTGVVTVALRRDSKPSPGGRPELLVWIQPVGTGEATITLGYSRHGKSARTEFRVRVGTPGTTPVPDAPAVVDDVQGVVDGEVDRAGGLAPGGGAVTIDVNELFVNVGWATRINFTAQSSDRRVVTVEITGDSFPGGDPRAGGRVVITPVGEGEVTITVDCHCRTTRGGTAPASIAVSASFTVTVGDPPIVDDLQGVVNGEVDRAGGLAPGGRAVAIDVNELFVNVGGAAGRDFSARSSDGTVVTVEITDNPHVVIRPVGDGTATVTVRYTGGGRSVSASFGVAVGEGFAPPVPALPLAAAGLLAALLFGAGLRRRGRRP